YKTGSYVGSETTAGNWTLLGSTTTAAGSPVPVPIGGLSIPAGQTYGIYLFFSANYTNGANTYSNADLSISTGVGLCNLFSGINNPRTWNGTVYYTVNTAESAPASQIDPQPVFTDGRINDYDMSNPVVVYPVRDADDNVAIHIYSDTGVLLLVVTVADILAAPENPESNIIIAESGGVSFARIRGEGQGLWQVTAPQYNGKTYVLIFSELYANAGYTSYEE
ncbi:MAG: hypothetical protein WBC91_15835, partial [Phototrophicaceae bacterium]